MKKGIIFNGVEYNLYAVRGGDMFLCESLEDFAWQNRVELKVYESDIIPNTLEELEKMIDEINIKFEKTANKKGWFLISKEDDE